MILPARAPLSPFGWPLRALYVALNSPVVTLEGMPRGPASAAVALHEEGASLCVRSAKTGQIRWFVTSDDLRSDTRVAVDAALSFAESMGFLFDDDEVTRRGDTGAAEAATLWQQLCGEETEGASDGMDFALDLEAAEALDPDLEILLGEGPSSPATQALDGAAEERMAAPRADLAPAAVLTKFRRVSEPGEGEAPGQGQPSDLRLRLMSRF